MSTASEGQFKHEGATFYTKTWTPDGPTKAKLIFVHGFSEHINRYNDFFPRLAEQGIQVFGWDQRGWGRSVVKPAHKGLTGPTSQVIADVAAFLNDKLLAKDETPNLPVFVMGHSMGGGEVLTLAGDSQYAELVGRVRGWILECPFVGFPAGEEPSSFKIFAGRLVGRLLPKQQLKHVVPPEYLSRDEAVVQAVRDDPLCHNTGTLEGLASLLDRTTLLSSGRVQLGSHVKSVLLTHGTEDRACSYDAALKFIEQQHGVNDKTTKSYNGAYHQLHADHCKDEFTNDIIEWILERSDQPVSTTEPLEAKL
ncbi:alpha/beta hydrolase [Pochonia chlamydosporia 170]|uniref:Alpha/beta hydrolase n=1 Tax=Pochonia chlamydosporia 170 TaxID=1380566 RepID=A0A179FT79_METCM|nr:alpha/beta hydrolase [Pochonia chlamydosporia 170]OAQ68303.1 alpha/beta hydrolase [Pochonia chlamydosporia 170]